MPKRNRLTASQKAQIVLEAIREDKSVAQIAAQRLADGRCSARLPIAPQPVIY
jgi:hypothetical protein